MPAVPTQAPVGGPGRVAKTRKLIRQLAKASCLTLSGADQALLEKLLQKELKVPQMPQKPAELWDALQDSVHRKIIGSSAKAYLHSLKTALGLCEYLQSSETIYEQFVPLLADRLNLKITKGLDLHIIAVRAVVDYGADRRVWSRDAQALKNLQRKSVRASKLIKWQLKNGGGVDSWAKEEQAYRRSLAAKAGGSPISKLSTASQAIAELRQGIGQGAGAVMLLKKNKKNVLICLRKMKLKNPRTKVLWPKIKSAISTKK